MPSLSTIASNVIHGIEQAVKILNPLDSPSGEYGSPPSWWYSYFWSSDWYNNLDSNYRPNWTWCYFWTTGSLRTIGDWALDEVRSAGYALEDLIRSWVGYVQGGYDSFSTWLSTVDWKVGSPAFWFASNLAEGVNWLFDRLPPEITYNVQSWDDWLRGWADWVLAWVGLDYDDLVAFGQSAWTWVTGIGQAVESWYNAAHSWLDTFRYDPYGQITGWLGDDWRFLASFARDPIGHVVGWLGGKWADLVKFAEDCLAYWYNLWGAYATDLESFLRDPLGFVYDRAEDFLSDKW